MPLFFVRSRPRGSCQGTIQPFANPSDWARWHWASSSQAQDKYREGRLGLSGRLSFLRGFPLRGRRSNNLWIEILFNDISIFVVPEILSPVQPVLYHVTEIE